MFSGPQTVSGKLPGFSHRLFQRECFIRQTKRLRTFQRATVSGHRLVVGKNALRLRGRLLRVGQSALVLARMDEMMRQSFNRNRRLFAMLLESLSGAQMQTSPANWVQLFVQHLA